MWHQPEAHVAHLPPTNQRASRLKNFLLFSWVSFSDCRPASDGPQITGFYHGNMIIKEEYNEETIHLACSLYKNDRKSLRSRTHFIKEGKFGLDLPLCQMWMSAEQILRRSFTHGKSHWFKYYEISCGITIGNYNWLYIFGWHLFFVLAQMDINEAMAIVFKCQVSAWDELKSQKQ